MRRHLSKFDSRHPAAGYTLLELVVASASAAVLMAGLGSSLFIAAKSLDVVIEPQADNRSAQQAIDLINRDLQSALQLDVLTETSITMQVPDRNDDGDLETIVYSWTGTAGDPLTQKYNEEAPIVIATNVQDFTLIPNP